MEGSSLTEKQQKALIELKKLCNDIILPSHDDHYLLKWLKARDYNSQKSAEMFRKSMAWRKRTGTDTILENWDPPEVLKKYYAGGLGGYDKDGYPVWIDLASYMDFKGLLHSAKKADIIKYEARQLEIARKSMKEQSEKLGKTIDQVTVIMDVGKLSMKHLWGPAISCFNDIMAMTEANYPENLRALYIINAPRIFPITFNMVKPLLAEETKQKIQVLGSNWKEKLRENIDPNQLPQEWGGNLCDPDGDPCCRSKICVGGEVPKSYYMTTRQQEEDAFVSKTVERRSLFQVKLQVTHPGSAIRWEFKTLTYDIGFGIFMATNPTQGKVSDMKEVLPLEKVNSQMVMQDGIITCEKEGTYVVAFDNRYSWVHSKNLLYCLEVIRPAQHTEESNNDVSKYVNGDVHTATELASEVAEDTDF